MSLQTQRLDNSLRIMYYYKWRVNQTQLALEPVITCFIRLFFLVVGLALDCKPKALHMANKHHLLSFLKPPLHSKDSGFSHLFYHPSSQIAEDSWSLWVQGFFFFKDWAKVDLELKILLASPRITDTIHHFWMVLVFCF